MKMFIIFVVCVFLLTKTARAAWQIEYVGNPRYFQGSSLKVDSQGRSHVAYGSKQLYYAVFSNGSWKVQVVDPTLNSGDYCSLAIDSSDFPSISYSFYKDPWGSPEYGLRFAKWDGSTWHIQTVESHVSVGPYTSLAIDALGHHAISYCDTGNKCLKLARWVGFAWIIETVDSRDDYYPSLVFFPSGYPGISYYDRAGGALALARWDGSAWKTEFVDAAGGDVGLYSSLALGSGGRPVISYYDNANGNLKLARWDGSTWTIEVVDSQENVGWNTSLVLDSAHNPLISYFDSGNRNVKLARWIGSAWVFETVDSADYTGDHRTSLALDASGNPLISYQSGLYTGLKQARWDGSTWTIDLVDKGAAEGGFASIAIDRSGNTAISYVDFEYVIEHLKVARWDGAVWKVETVDGIEGYTGSSESPDTSIAFDSLGRPAVSYYDTKNGVVKLARWDGLSWNIEVVDSRGGARNSLAFDASGNPAISYAEGSEVRFASWNGAAWSVEDVDSGSILYYQDTSLAFDPAGYPAISFYDSSGHGLTLARWDGMVWNFELVDPIPAHENFFDSLAFDPSGFPGISYWSEYTHSLKFARWDGTAWVIEIVDSDHTVPTENSLVFNSSGDPFIAYTEPEMGSHHLMYAARNGGLWVSEAVDDVYTTYVRGNVTLALSPTDRPSIAYFECQAYAMKLAQPDWYSILRGDSIPTLALIAKEALPWTDPDPVLTGAFPSLLYYRVEGRRIALKKEGQSITILKY
jgi:hypothetical protein